MAFAERTQAVKSLPSLVAWTSVFVGTLCPIIIAREFVGGAPVWLLVVQLGFLCGLIGLTVVVERLRKLRVFALVLLVVRGQFLLDWGTSNQFLDTAVTSGFYAWAAYRTVSFAFSVVLLIVLFRVGYDRDDMLLRRGSLAAEFVPVSFPGLTPSG